MLKKIKLGDKGVSPLVSFVVLIMISFTVIGLVLMVGLPAIDKAKESAALNEATQNMRILDNTIREVASEGLGAFRKMLFRISAGSLKINEKANSIDYSLGIKSGLISPGTFIQDGNLIISSGVFAQASETDFDADGNIDLVLENEIIRVILVKNGSSTQNTTINTGGLIKMINYKETGVNLTLVDTSITLDESPTSSAGTGYTELVAKGEHLPKAEAVAHVYTSFLNYDVVFSLPAMADFVEIKIQNAYYT